MVSQSEIIVMRGMRDLPLVPKEEEYSKFLVNCPLTSESR